MTDILGDVHVYGLPFRKRRSEISDLPERLDVSANELHEIRDRLKPASRGQKVNEKLDVVVGACRVRLTNVLNYFTLIHAERESIKPIGRGRASDTTERRDERNDEKKSFHDGEDFKTENTCWQAISDLNKRGANA